MPRVLKNMVVALDSKPVIVQAEEKRKIKKVTVDDDGNEFVEEVEEEIDRVAEELEAVRKMKEEYEQVLEQKEQIIEEATKRAHKIIQEAKEEIEVYKMNSEVAVSAEFENARNDGYNEGIKTGTGEGMTLGKQQVQRECRKMLAELAHMLTELENKKSDLLDYYQDQLKYLSVVIAEKIVKAQLTLDPTVIVNIVREALRTYKNQEWINIMISSQDAYEECLSSPELINYLKSCSEHIEVVSKHDLPSGTVMIETPTEIVDVGVDTQISAVKQILSQKK